MIWSHFEALWNVRILSLCLPSRNNQILCMRFYVMWFLVKLLCLFFLFIYTYILSGEDPKIDQQILIKIFIYGPISNVGFEDFLWRLKPFQLAFFNATTVEFHSVSTISVSFCLSCVELRREYRYNFIVIVL